MSEKSQAPRAERALKGRQPKRVQPKKEHQVTKGQGSFYFRTSDQRWIGVIDLGRLEDGKRNRITVSDRDEDTAWEKLLAKQAQVFTELQKGTLPSPGEVIDSARALGQNPAWALVDAGYLHASDITPR